MTFVSPMGAYINTSNNSVLSGLDELLYMLQQSIPSTQPLGTTTTSGVFADDNISRVVSNSGSAIVNTAMKYLGYNESNGSYLKFTDGREIAWCAAFVSYVVKETLGDSTPAGFGSASVSTLRSWGESNGRYISRSQWNQVKPGDIMIQKENGASHTGIVTKVDPDGTIHTIEGNTSDMVAERTYKPGSKGYNKISGFIMM